MICCRFTVQLCLLSLNQPDQLWLQIHLSGVNFLILHQADIYAMASEKVRSCDFSGPEQVW